MRERAERKIALRLHYRLKKWKKKRIMKGRAKTCFQFYMFPLSIAMFAIHLSIRSQCGWDIFFALWRRTVCFRMPQNKRRLVVLLILRWQYSMRFSVVTFSYSERIVQCDVYLYTIYYIGRFYIYDVYVWIVRTVVNANEV